MPLNSRTVPLLLALWSLAGCQVDDINVEVLKKGSEVVVTFRYENSTEPVLLTDILVQEANNGRIIWDVKTYDPSAIKEKFDLEMAKELPLELAALTEAVLGMVPAKFRQCVPGPNNHPQFETGKSYEIFVRGAGHSGHARFIM